MFKLELIEGLKHGWEDNNTEILFFLTFDNMYWIK